MAHQWIHHRWLHQKWLQFDHPRRTKNNRPSEKESFDHGRSHKKLIPCVAGAVDFGFFAMKISEFRLYSKKVHQVVAVAESRCFLNLLHDAFLSPAAASPSWNNSVGSSHHRRRCLFGGQSGHTRSSHIDTMEEGLSHHQRYQRAHYAPEIIVSSSNDFFLICYQKFFGTLWYPVCLVVATNKKWSICDSSYYYAITLKSLWQ